MYRSQQGNSVHPASRASGPQPTWSILPRHHNNRVLATEMPPSPKFNNLLPHCSLTNPTSAWPHSQPPTQVQQLQRNHLCPLPNSQIHIHLRFLLPSHQNHSPGCGDVNLNHPTSFEAECLTVMNSGEFWHQPVRNSPLVAQILLHSFPLLQCREAFFQCRLIVVALPHMVRKLPPWAT